MSEERTPYDAGAGAKFDDPVFCQVCGVMFWPSEAVPITHRHESVEACLKALNHAAHMLDAAWELRYVRLMDRITALERALGTTAEGRPTDVGDALRTLSDAVSAVNAKVEGHTDDPDRHMPGTVEAAREAVYRKWDEQDLANAELGALVRKMPVGCLWRLDTGRWRVEVDESGKAKVGDSPEAALRAALGEAEDGKSDAQGQD